MSYSIEEALEIAKDFTAPKKKSIRDSARPALRGAYIDEEYVWAIDGVKMIRIRHNENVQSSHIHGYTPEDARYFSSEGTVFPNVGGLLPKEADAICNLTITDIQEWLSAHELICTLKHNQFHTTLNTYEKTLTAKSLEKGIFGNSMSFIYRGLPFDDQAVGTKLYYNASFMVKFLKLAKKLKAPQMNMLIYGARRTFILKMEDIFILVLPLDGEYKPVPEKVKKEPKPKPEKKPKGEPKPKAVKSKAKPKTKSKRGKK